MGQLLHLRGDPHEETQRLLPWFVTGQLDQADRLMVSAHLEACAECRDELAMERRLGAAIQNLPLADADPWERFAASLPIRPADRRWWRQPVRVAWFAAAQAAVVLLCVGIALTRHDPAPAPAYRALGDAPAALSGNIVVMFAADTSDTAIRHAIGTTPARLVKGPTAAGAYILAVGQTERDAALAKLRVRRDVILAQPIDVPAP